MEDKRRHKRYNSLHLVSYQLFNEAKELCGQGIGRTLNISQSGILLEIENRVEDDIKTVNMEIALEDSLIILTGFAVFCKKTDRDVTECGIKFLKVSREGFDVLVAFMKGFYAEAGKKASLLRSGDTKIDNVVLTLSKEHRIITDYAITYRETLEGFGAIYISQTIATLFEYMEADLANHFNFEEQIIFPAALYETSSESRVARLVRKLKDDHVWFMSEITEITSSLKSTVSEHSGIDAWMKDRIDSFMDRLKSHAREEMRDLFPEIDADEEKLKTVNRLMD